MLYSSPDLCYLGIRRCPERFSIPVARMMPGDMHWISMKVILRFCRSNSIDGHILSGLRRRKYRELRQDNSFPGAFPGPAPNLWHRDIPKADAPLAKCNIRYFVSRCHRPDWLCPDLFVDLFSLHCCNSPGRIVHGKHLINRDKVRKNRRFNSKTAVFIWSE